MKVFLRGKNSVYNSFLAGENEMNFIFILIF